jgi:hypothetical protein
MTGGMTWLASRVSSCQASLQGARRYGDRERGEAKAAVCPIETSRISLFHSAEPETATLDIGTKLQQAPPLSALRRVA